ncbi:hypothetical protein DVH21_13605 [Micromonospora aurantiaca]|uniref:Uncharacterized protein n=1 Tax=Micromonospora aurantiaca (nom. illeg.) TaxID=47850 RepID=A0A6N3JZ03_9ACTN|nr:hypothetical protein DVH21_13605 [Micromonospora aurantiaca]
MAEDDIARTGIRVGGWLPTPDDGVDAPERPAGPRRLPGDTDPATPRTVNPPDGEHPAADADDRVSVGDLEPPGTAVWPPPRTGGPPTPDLPAAGPLPANMPVPGTLPAGPPAPGPPTSTPPSPDPPASRTLGPGPPASRTLGPGLLASGTSASVPEPRPSPPGGRVPLVGPAPIGLHLSGPSPVRPGAADEPAGSGLPQEAEARPGRHSARESIPARLAGLTGGLSDVTGGTGARLRAAARAAKARLSRTLAPIAGPMRPPPDAPATRVAAARARRQRRRAVLAAVAVTGLVAALAYAARSSTPPPLTRETAPVAAPGNQAPGNQAPSDQAPSGQAPSGQAPGDQAPATGDPVAPGGPLLDVDLAPLPGSLSLTDLGTRDWRHWGGTGADSFHRKAGGTGEIQDPGGERLEHNAGACDLQWTDGTPTARQEGTRAGVFQRGAGKSFTLGVTGSGDVRTVRLFVGTFSAGARLDLSLSSGGDPAVREVALAAGDRFYQYVIRFRAAPGERLLIRWHALTVTGGQNDGVALQAITVS